MSSVSNDVSVLCMNLALQGNVLSGLDHLPTLATDFFRGDKMFVIFPCVCVSSAALDKPAECLVVHG